MGTDFYVSIASVSKNAHSKMALRDSQNHRRIWDNGFFWGMVFDAMVTEWFLRNYFWEIDD